MDLSEEEYEAFGSGIAALAAQRERKPRDFEAFQAFLERNGPYGCIVDGANAALFGQNFEEGGFSFGQIDAVLLQLQQERPNLKPLVVQTPQFHTIMPCFSPLKARMAAMTMLAYNGPSSPSLCCF